MRSLFTRTYVHILLAVGILVLSAESCDTSSPRRMEGKRVGVPFKKEGNAWVLSKNKTDTIAEFEIEVAKESFETSQGLMYRKSMLANRGMLFIFDNEIVRSFWMKNTYISLDIIYVNQNKEVIHIARNTTPKSETNISSIKPAQYVFEVNAGTADSLGIAEGVHLIWEEDTP